MSLEQLSKTVDFVQDATPSASDANDGETYLDTSQSPPQLKVFNGSANAFVRPRSVQNLDAPVSGAGATQSDIETAIDNSTTASTVSNNLDAPVSAAGADIQFIGGFNLSLASFLQSFSFTDPSTPVGVAFSADGTSMFIIGDSELIFEASLSGAFDLSTASLTGTTFDVGQQADSPTDITLSADGTSMFVIGDKSDSVHQYSLSTAFDLSTTSFSGTSLDVSSNASAPQGVTFSSDGTFLFVIGQSSGSVDKFELTTGFDLSTASPTAQFFDVTQQENSPTNVAFNRNGTSMFVTGTNSDSVFQYSLSTGFDLNTTSFSGISFDISGQTGSPGGLVFSPDGTSMFVAPQDSASVFQYLVGEVGPK